MLVNIHLIDHFDDGFLTKISFNLCLDDTNTFVITEPVVHDPGTIGKKS